MLSELGIIPLKISLPFRLNHVNCFLAEGDEGWTVIDAGLHHPYSIETWQKIVPDKKITNIVVTHYHPDHYGYVGRLQEMTGAQVWMTRQDAETAGHMWTEERFRLIREQYSLYGVPEDMVEQMAQNTEQFIQFVTPHPQIDHYLEEGQIFTLGKHEYEVIFTPGHAEGMICLFNRKESILLSADHVLPKITPNISYWFLGDANPLQSYLQSLEKMKALCNGPACQDTKFNLLR